MRTTEDSSPVLDEVMEPSGAPGLSSGNEEELSSGGEEEEGGGADGEGGAADGEGGDADGEGGDADGEGGDGDGEDWGHGTWQDEEGVFYGGGDK